jgi:hypothetical protein
MSIGQVQQLQLEGITIVGDRVTELDLGFHQLPGTNIITTDVHAF